MEEVFQDRSYGFAEFLQYLQAARSTRPISCVRTKARSTSKSLVLELALLAGIIGDKSGGIQAAGE
jgi:hypothetical protein